MDGLESYRSYLLALSTGSLLGAISALVLEYLRPEIAYYRHYDAASRSTLLTLVNFERIALGGSFGIKIESKRRFTLHVAAPCWVVATPVNDGFNIVFRGMPPQGVYKVRIEGVDEFDTQISTISEPPKGVNLEERHWILPRGFKRLNANYQKPLTRFYVQVCLGAAIGFGTYGLAVGLTAQEWGVLDGRLEILLLVPMAIVVWRYVRSRTALEGPLLEISCAYDERTVEQTT